MSEAKSVDEADFHSSIAKHRGLAMLVVMTGVLITAIDTTIVVLALPEIEKGLRVGLASVIWIVIGYLLVITLLATQVGRFGDMYGRVKMYEAGFLVFVLGSMACALAWNESSIIIFRIIQGIGGAFVSANSGAIIAGLYPPHHRGKAYGYNAIGWSLGAVLGVVLGGLIVTYLSWRWIFWVNVPIGIVAIILATRTLRETIIRMKHKTDFIGMISLGLGLFGILWAMTKLATSSLDLSVYGYLIGGIFLLIIFGLIENKKAEPMLRLSIFKIPTMTPTLLAALFQGLANFAVLFLVIMYLQGTRGLSPIHASLLLIPGYIVGSVIGPFAGRLSDKVGPVIPATLGLAIQILALFIYANLGMSTGLWVVVAASIVNGIGGSSFFPANNSAVMKASPPNMFGISSGMLRTFSNIGMVFSFSVAILVAARSIPKRLAFSIFVGTTNLKGHLASDFASGLHMAFYALMVFMVIAALLSAARFGGIQHTTKKIKASLSR
jgi:EmrB/QacA subfamily drug resistance transporter